MARHGDILPKGLCPDKYDCIGTADTHASFPLNTNFTRRRLRGGARVSMVNVFGFRLRCFHFAHTSSTVCRLRAGHRQIGWIVRIFRPPVFIKLNAQSGLSPGCHIAALERRIMGKPPAFVQVALKLLHTKLGARRSKCNAAAMSRRQIGRPMRTDLVEAAKSAIRRIPAVIPPAWVSVVRI